MNDANKPGTDWLVPAATDAVRPISTRGRVRVAVAALALGGVGFGIWAATGMPKKSSEPLAFFLEEKLPADTGVDFVHEKGALAPFFDNVKPFMQAVSAAACTTDVERDGDLDLYLVNSGNGTDNKLFLNETPQDGSAKGAFKFRHVVIDAIKGKNGTDGFSADCVFADVDNDGFSDLFVGAASQGPHLFMNVPAESADAGAGGRTFVEVTESSGIPKYMNGFAVSSFDVENDGDLDLILSSYFGENYLEEDIPGRPRMHTFTLPEHENAGRMLPNNWGDATNGGPKHFLLNDGKGRFTEQDNTAWGLSDTRFTFDIGTADVNLDGFTDVYFGNDFGPDQLYINDGGKRFVLQKGVLPNEVGQDSFKGMNAELADIDGDAYPEIYVTNVFHPVLPEGNILWKNVADASTVSGRNFQNVAGDLGVKDGGWGWGARFVDLDLDGDKDLVATNGYITQNPKKDYWYRLSRLVAGDRRLIVDSRKWPRFDDFSMSGHQVSHVFVWDGDRFWDRAADVGVTRVFDGRGVMFSDFDADGRPDVMIVPQGFPYFLARNVFRPTATQPEAPHWVGVRVTGDGVKVNKDAVGARVRVTQGARVLHYEVSAGNGLSAQSMNWIVAGLGQSDAPVDVLVRFTDGTTTEHKGLAADRYHDIAYGERTAAVHGASTTGGAR